MSAHSASDSEAIQRCKQGDPSGLEVLVARYYTAALRLAYLLTGDRLRAEDTVQDSFLQFYRTVDRFLPDRDFEPWFHRIVTNMARQSNRTVARRREVRLERFDDGTEFDAATLQEDEALSLSMAPLALPDPQLQAERAEERTALLSALDALTLKQREVVVLRYFAGYPDREIAALVGCRPGAARQRLADGLRALGHIIRERYPWLIDTSLAYVLHDEERSSRKALPYGLI